MNLVIMEPSEQSAQCGTAQLDKLLKLLYWSVGIILFIGMLNWVAALQAEEIPENASVFYWFYPNADYLVVPQLCILPILIILTICFFFKRTVVMVLFWGIAACHIFLLLVTAAAFVPSGVAHLDSVKLRDKTYHLAEECVFDGPCETVLCECDSNGYWCKCHHTGEVRVPQPFYLQVDRDKNQIEVHSSYEGTIYRYNIPSP